MLSRESAKKSFTNKLFLLINIFQFTFRDKNNLIIMYELLNVHGLPCKFLVSILDLLTRNQFRWKKFSVLQSALQQAFQLKEPIHIAIFVIISLLTNISLDKTIEIISKLFTNSTEKTCFNSHLQAARWSSCWHSALSNFR